MGKLKQIMEKISEFKTGNLSAEEAYSFAKFNKIINKDDLLKKYIDEISMSIRFKSLASQYSLSVDLDKDMIERLDDIIAPFKSLNFNTNIIEVNGDKFLHLSWKSLKK